jgi:MFS family permease
MNEVEPDIDALPDGPIAQAARRVGSQKLVVASCVLGLVAMAMMCWSVLDPTPFPVLVAMSVGQGLGTLSLLCYLAAVFVEVWRQRNKR